MNEQEIKMLKKRGHLYDITGFLLSMAGGLLVAGSLVVDETFYLITAIGFTLMCAGLFGFMATAQSYHDQAHTMQLQLSHIHRDGCRLKGLVTVVERETHEAASIGGWADTTDSSVTVVDSETTECAECKSRTRFERGQPPQLVQSK